MAEGVSESIRGHGGTPAKPIREHAYGTAADTATSLRLNNERITTLIGLTALGIGALVFKFNVGLVAMTVAVALALLSPKTQKAAIDKVSWSTVLLISGIITYVGVMEKAGTVDYVANGISSLGMPLLVALLLCFFGLCILDRAARRDHPARRSLSAAGSCQRHWRGAAIAISTTIVDTSPFSTNGALVVANAPDDRREQVLRQLLIYSALIAIIGPIVCLAGVRCAWTGLKPSYIPKACRLPFGMLAPVENDCGVLREVGFFYALVTPSQLSFAVEKGLDNNLNLD